MLEQIDMFGGVTAPVSADRGIKAAVPPCPTAMKAAAAAIKAMPAGGSVVYHTGRLAADRMVDAIVGGTAAAYSAAADKGVVLLSQRKISDRRFEYIAIKKRR